MKTLPKDVMDFIDGTVIYDREGQYFWITGPEGYQQVLAELRGWGRIQNMFGAKTNNFDEHAAAKFQDEVGEWVADAINRKLKDASQFREPSSPTVKEYPCKCSGTVSMKMCTDATCVNPPVKESETGEQEEHECEFFLLQDIAVHVCECDHVTISDKSTIHEYVPLKKYQEQKLSQERLTDFLLWVEKSTYYFEDKDVTPTQVVTEYLNTQLTRK